MGRLKSLCDGGRLQEAVDMLLNAPLDAKRVKHFNLLMKTASTLAKYSEMYNLFIEMKRRGFIPNAGTYQTMLGGYAQIEDWSHRTKQIAQVHNVFENYRSWVTALKAEDPKSLHLTVGPYNPYFKILGATKQYEKIYDVYYDMDQDGPLSPDVKVLTGLFDALVETKREPGSTQEIRPQNISFAKVVWRNMTKKMEASPEFKLDSHLIRAVLRLFRSGSAADRIFALDVICRDNLGLAKPGETAPPPKVELTEYIVNQVIALCNNSNKFRLSIHFAQQLMDRPLKDGESSILTHYILEDVLYAYCNQETMGSMNEAERALNILDWMIRQNALQYNDNLAPRLITFSRVLEISWRGGDWGVATRTFDLMTGYKAADFADIPADVKRSTPQMERRSPGKNFLPTTIQMCHLVRTALNSGVVANMRQALRIFVHFGGERFFLQGALQNDTLPEVAQTRYLPFYAQTTAETVSGLVKAVLAAADTEQVAGKQEIEQWRNLMTAAGQSLRQATVPTPLLRRPVVEQSRLGTSAQLDREDMVIDSLMSQRTQVSPRRK
ncbi:hypothetical protein CERSUDRAFT_130817 [Gelatoporia subvermispora B]|uniref:Pentacotripeptide-repeat region of PRORP domain-containing protein n=1 Tax=Ceriporiopsis subvermispora (strain B) TaxID=914234 RepID=M2RQF2_CERS8|nr:hypothetical protein CERSUDRAFT_130817 [Gelatoporia subvermispora B]